MPDVRRTIVITTPTRDLAVFSRLAKTAATLKPHARVEVNIAALAQKAALPVSEVDSPWHAYTSFNPTLEHFVPSEKLAPFFDADAVAANRALLTAKAAILRDLGLGAAFWNYLPNYLPEAVYAAYPHWRGPRTDHPRRSTRPAFAPCVDQPEVLEQVREMTARLVGLVPEVGTFYFKTNDAGPGLCWSYWQYAGPNGPASCRGVGMGPRVQRLIEAVQAGAADAGGGLAVHFGGNFSEAELDDIAAHLPPRSSVRGRGVGPTSLRNRADTCYPVTGIFDPVDLLRPLSTASHEMPETTILDLRCSYDRGMEDPGTAEAMIDLLGRVAGSKPTGRRTMLDLLCVACVEWVGPADADRLLDTFVELHEAFTYKEAALPKLSVIYGGVSMRYLTRPLLFDGAALWYGDGDGFLPHVFNVSRHAAAADFLDQHGAQLRPVDGLAVSAGDREDPRLWTADALAGRFERLAQRFDAFGDAPLDGALRRTATGLRLYACMLRTCAAFYAVGVLIRRHAADERRPPADPWRGDADLIAFNEIMRDELDNTHRLIVLLEAGGLGQVQRAHGPVPEDTFVLGADLIDRLRTKCRLMVEHWCDAEASLATPNR